MKLSHLVYLQPVSWVGKKKVTATSVFLFLRDLQQTMTINCGLLSIVSPLWVLATPTKLLELFLTDLFGPALDNIQIKVKTENALCQGIMLTTWTLASLICDHCHQIFKPQLVEG